MKGLERFLERSSNTNLDSVYHAFLQTCRRKSDAIPDRMVSIILNASGELV